MSVNIFTLNVIKKTPFAMKLYDTLGGYILEYLLSDNHAVDDKIEEKTVELIKECNAFAIANNMEELCEIYDDFGLEQDAMIIYKFVGDQLVQEKQQVEDFEITLSFKV